MRNILVCLIFGTMIAVAGCSGRETKEEYRSSMLEKLPFVYKMTVQQGNIVTEEMVDRLEPGMTKSQVRFLLGTPTLADMFHTDRWDYTYTIRRGRKDLEMKRLSVFFQDDALVRTLGDIRPDPKRAATRPPEEIVVPVPDWEDNRGFFAKAFSKVGVEPAE